MPDPYVKLGAGGLKECGVLMIDGLMLMRWWLSIHIFFDFNPYGLILVNKIIYESLDLPGLVQIVLFRIGQSQRIRNILNVRFHRRLNKLIGV